MAETFIGASTEHIQMGIGEIGSDTLIIKRKFRWTFEIKKTCKDGSPGQGNVPPHFVKVAARPNLSIEETEINYLNGKMYIPGKGTWETITVTYYDVASGSNKGLWDWLASVYDFTDPTQLHQGSQPQDYIGTGILVMYDGCGQALEIWNLFGCWPQAINFNDLDYANSEEANIEVTLRYRNVMYKPLCPEYTIKGCCTPCR